MELPICRLYISPIAMSIMKKFDRIYPGCAAGLLYRPMRMLSGARHGWVCTLLADSKVQVASAPSNESN